MICACWQNDSCKRKNGKNQELKKYKYKRKYITSGWEEHSASPLGPIPLAEEPEDSPACFCNYFCFFFFDRREEKEKEKS